MKVVILAGGLGTRISEYTKTIPKPMIKICGKPIIQRIIDHYYNYGHKEFYIALGYKANLVKEYFLNYYEVNSDFTVNLSDGSVISHMSNHDMRVAISYALSWPIRYDIDIEKLKHKSFSNLSFEKVKKNQFK